MKKEIKITNGKVVLKEFVDRKTYRKYKEKLSENVSIDTSENTNMPVFNMELATEALVIGMIESAEINGSPVTADQLFIDNLKQRDFDNILFECNKMLQSDDEKKSKSAES